MFDRHLDLPALLRRKSALRLGPRLTGKSTLAKRTLDGALFVDLLDAGQFRSLAAHPERLGDLVREQRRTASTELMVGEGRAPGWRLLPHSE